MKKVLGKVKHQRGNSFNAAVLTGFSAALFIYLSFRINLGRAINDYPNSPRDYVHPPIPREQSTASNLFPSPNAVPKHEGNTSNESIVPKPVKGTTANPETTWFLVKPQKNAAKSEIADAPLEYRSKPVSARLIVLTMNRHASLRRLLRSLNKARYKEDRIDLDIWVDRRNDDAPLDANVLDVALSAKWLYGKKTVYQRRRPGGLYQQWLWTWNITDDSDEFATILEDDLELAPAWYEWLTEARQMYGKDNDTAGFTLQRLELQLRGVQRRLQFPRNTPVFKHHLHGSWGFAPRKKVWLEFRRWFEITVRSGKKPYVHDLLSTQWYMSQERRHIGYAPTMWTQWFIKFSDERGYFTVTPHLLDGTTLCANWKEPGLHFSNKTNVGRDKPLFKGNASDFKWPKHLMKFDWDGTILNPAA